MTTAGCLAKADDARLVASLRVGRVNDDAVKPVEQVDPLLTIGFMSIFPCGDRAVADCLAIGEIQAMDADVGRALRFVRVGLFLP